MAQRPLHRRLLLNNEPNDSLLEGDLIEIDHTFYSHWAVYIGRDEVVHLKTPEEFMRNIWTRFLGTILLFLPVKLFGVTSITFQAAREELNVVAEGSTSYLNNKKDQRYHPFPPIVIVRIAQVFARRRTPVRYNLIYRNCEHFASYCRYGINISDQVNTVLKWIAAVATLVLSYT